ncbi:hypothetical protein DPMN_154260 [Dreissena polymorpha]|uniref:Uncharacterized protein n=1 Tax=Dreissena polymorpha TaxID=45954 RepID=A0A9D4FLN1_DREPO|nr:hypothetical protein DPMN_154260 [Dreissena polymorpha]
MSVPPTIYSRAVYSLLKTVQWVQPYNKFTEVVTVLETVVWVPIPGCRSSPEYSHVGTTYPSVNGSRSNPVDSPMGTTYHLVTVSRSSPLDSPLGTSYPSVTGSRSNPKTVLWVPQSPKSPVAVPLM